MAQGQFIPPKRTLMGPGPSDVSQRVLDALSRPTIGHLDPEFIRLMDEIKELLQYAFQTENALTMPVSAPGSAGMETCFVNLVEPGDKVIVCRNGVFGGRMLENVERCGGTAVMVDDAWGRAVDVEKVKAALEANPDAKIVAFVHAETSTGAVSDAKAIAELARQHDCLTIVDTVTSLGGSELRVDDWGLDAVYSGTQKCLSCIPGISPVTFSERALEKANNRGSKVQSWFLDLNLVTAYWGTGAKRAYHHTAPVNDLYAFHESLLMLKEEGLENSWARHQSLHEKLIAGLTVLGLTVVPPEGERLAQLNTVMIPEGIDDATVRGRLLADYNLEIGAGLGDFAGKAWRIGLMGSACTEDNVRFCLESLETVLIDLGADVEKGAAVTAAFA
ncbi:MAG: alanine--glyoxylate aminotransferase family protein [Gammaproteobacteria bacterium]|nr:alanine--glyoxylate aminotransferase family protein [Gammaproteobacteria bacterium]